MIHSVEIVEVCLTDQLKVSGRAGELESGRAGERVSTRGGGEGSLIGRVEWGGCDDGSAEGGEMQSMAWLASLLPGHTCVPLEWYRRKSTTPVEEYAVSASNIKLYRADTCRRW